MKKKPISIHFFGSPTFALPSLKILQEDPDINLTCVVTQEDQPSGRGMQLHTPPVGQEARSLNIPLFQPVSLKKINWQSKQLTTTSEDASIISYVNFLNSNEPPDFFIVVAYGKILPEHMLTWPKVDTLNVHPSLLPRWRGAAPLQRTLLAGDEKTGVCIMRLVSELDAGPIYAKEEYSLNNKVSLPELHDDLSRKGATLLLETIKKIAYDQITPTAQPEEGVTYAEKWTREDSSITWSDHAQKIANRIRACTPRPGAKTLLQGKDFKILSASAMQNNEISTNLGVVLPETKIGQLIPISKSRLAVACGENSYLELYEVQLAGKKAMSVTDFLKGNTLIESVLLGE